MASEKVAETSSGMPQLDFATFPNQVFWILVFTVLFYLIVRYVIVPRLESIMTSRQDLINADIQQAEEFNKEFLGCLPIHQDLRISADKGEPLTRSDPSHEVSKLFEGIAEKIKRSFH